METKIQAKILLLFTLFIYSYAMFVGLRHPIPALGDSFDYHIPIANMILSGQILHPGEVPLGQWYYPGASNVFHALFLWLQIPLTLSNLLPIAILSVVLWYLARTFALGGWMSMLFSLSIVSLTVFHRWGNAVSIDVWVAVYTISILTILKRKTHTDWTYVGIGVLWGMLLGSKYLVGIYPLVLLILFGKEFLASMSLKRIIYVLSPIIILGGWWYVRNYVLTGNPFYPLSMFGFMGDGLFLHTPAVWKTMLTHPLDVMNAIFSEYKLLGVGIGAVLIYGASHWKKMTKDSRLLLIAGASLCMVFCLFPMDPKSWIMVSSLRYSYSFAILFILCLFLVAKQWKKERELGYLVLLNAFPVLTMAYYPKLLILVFILFYLVMWMIEPKLDKVDTIK